MAVYTIRQARNESAAALCSIPKAVLVPCAGGRLNDFNQCRSLRDNFADLRCFDAAMLEREMRVVSGFRSNRGEEAAGRLGIEEKGAKFVRNGRQKVDTAFDELAIVFQSA